MKTYGLTLPELIGLFIDGDGLDWLSHQLANKLMHAEFSDENFDAEVHSFEQRYHRRVEEVLSNQLESTPIELVKCNGRFSLICDWSSALTDLYYSEGKAGNVVPGLEGTENQDLWVWRTFEHRDKMISPYRTRYNQVYSLPKTVLIFLAEQNQNLDPENLLLALNSIEMDG